MSNLDLEALIAALETETRTGGKWSARGLSLAAGGKPDLVRDILRGANKNPSADNLVGLAVAMGRDLAEFIKGGPGALPALPGKIVMRVTGAVAAGVWLEQTDWPYEDQYEVEVPQLHGTEAALDRFLVELRGYSMDRTIPPGSVLDCVRVKFSEIEPQPGELVIVERIAHDLTEMTCKRLERGPDGWELHCESTRPEFQEVIRIGNPDRDLHTDNDISVIGIVLEARQIHRKRRFIG